MKVEFKDNKQQIAAAFQRQYRAGLEAIGMEAEGYAKDECPVDTGRLRNSISHQVEDNEVYIGTNVEYAPWVEWTDMDHKTGKPHFLRDAASTHGDRYKSIMEAALKA